MKKYCIVNGDDFGASPGINRGIAEAHQHGILTSTSLMVDMPGAEEAAELSRDLSRLSVGIHVTITSEDFIPLIDFDSPDQCRAELERQCIRFQDLMGRLPTHIDAHHNIHRDPRVELYFLELSISQNLPLRENSAVRYFSNFYGQWDGETHLEQISESSMCTMLATEIGYGFTELSCHPGYIDPNFQSSYGIERETELQTLCSPVTKQEISDLGIELINYDDLNDLLAEDKSTEADNI